MKALLFLQLWALALLSFSCTDEAASRRALEAHGFTHIRFEGFAFFGCADDDEFRTAFAATNSQGKRVKGVVCCGVWQDCSIRW